MTAGPSPLLQGAALLLATTAVAAQTAAPADNAPATLEAVTVTAQKRAERLQDVPTAVSAVNGKSIEDTELRTTKDLAREIPGATGWNAESRARPRFFLRGIGSNEATNNAVQPIGVYADEVYLLNSMFLGGPLFDLDRVEVLRGPQGTLWGKNTTGGAYHFVSRKPTFAPEGYAKIGFGNYGQRLIEGAYGGPVQDDVLAQRISVHHETRDGWATNRQTGRSVGDLTDTALRYQLRANLTPDLRANLNVHVRKFDGTQTPAYPVTRPGVPTFGYTSPYTATGNRSTVDYNGGDPATKVSTSGVTANIEWDVAGLTLTSITAVDVGTREAAPQDSDWTPVEVSRSYSRNQARQLSQEVRLASPRTDRFNWIAGAYYFKDRNRPYSATATTPPVSTNPGLTYAQYQQETESKALFGSVTYNLTDRFAITGGLRYTAERVAIDLDSLGSVATVNGTVPFGSNAWWLVGQANTPLATIATQDEDRTWHNLGFDLTPQYKFSEHQLAYARVASGYRSGNYAGGNTLSGPPSVVQPEKLRAYEVGYKSDWLDRRVVFNAAAYYYDYQDMQLTVNRVVNGQFASVLANAGQGKVTGIEFETRALVARGLTLRANASALRTQFTELTTGNVDYAGYNFARVPRVTGLLGADYALPLGSGTLLLGTDWSYNSKVNFNVTNNTDAYALQEGFWLGTLRAGYAFAGGKTVLNAYVNNVANQRYKIQAMLYSNARYNTTLGDPRTVGLTLTTRFF